MSPTDSEELELERERLLAQLLADEGLEETAAVGPRNPGESIPVTFAQEVLWLLDRSTPGLSAYNTPLARRIRGPLDFEALSTALTALADRHEALRTVFQASGDGAVQVVLPTSPVSLIVTDLEDLPATDREAAALKSLRAIADMPFDIATEPGFRAAVARISGNEHILLLLTHHIVSDAWSYGVLLRDLSVLYSAAASTSPHALPAPALQLGDYAAWQRATANAGAIDEGLAYWRNRLDGASSLELPTDFPRPVSQGFGGARSNLVLSVDLQRNIRELAKRKGVTVYMVLLAAYATVLRRYAPQDEVVIGSAVAGRTRHEFEEIVGYFSQALPMRVRFENNPTLDAVLESVRDTVLGAFEHQDTPLESIVLELQRGRAQSHAPLFRVVLTMQDLLGSELELNGAQVSPVELDQSSTKFDLTLLATERNDGLDLSLWYRTDLFAGGYADRFLGHLRNVLNAMTSNTSQHIADIVLLSATEREQLTEWNATTVQEGPAATLVSLFEAQAARVPDVTALVGGSVATGENADLAQLSYAALNQQANQLAHELVSHGVSANAPVGLLIDREVETVVALLGILKAGGCYVPLSEDVPPARIAQQLTECGAKVVVTTSELAAKLPATVAAIRLNDSTDLATIRAHDASNPSIRVAPDSLAYVLYTSGSTGVPKGVAITHANIVHYARAVSRVLADVSPATAGDGLGALDGMHFGMLSTFAADLGLTSVMPSLLSGSTLHILSKDTTTNPARYADYLRDHPLDIVKVTPNHLMALTTGKQGTALAPLLPRRWLVLGGEALRPDVARELLRAGTCRVLNHYGPTETTVGVCTFEATNESIDKVVAMGAQTVPVGAPLANTHTFVVDPNGAEQPIGIPGELLLGGHGVAAGYLGRTDLTEERFSQFAGERVYHTGDRVRRLESGVIEFLGRADNQVKVRGFRVELGEIAGAIRSHAGVDQAEVLVFKSGEEDLVVGYVVPRQGYAVSHSDRPTPERLRDWVATLLPEYMIPASIVIIEQMPLTANGKVDRAALPVPDASKVEAGQSVAPRNEIEEQLCAIWCDVLKKDSIGVTDNFLALGGHSLLAIRVLGRISKAFGVRLPLRTLFETPTVEALALAIASARAAS
ncbi:MAG: amino acid adenylation domain-containing protein [Gemmatimonadaceae bacterium]